MSHLYVAMHLPSESTSPSSMACSHVLFEFTEKLMNTAALTVTSTASRANSTKKFFRSVANFFFSAWRANKSIVNWSSWPPTDDERPNLPLPELMLRPFESYADFGWDMSFGLDMTSGWTRIVRDSLARRGW